MKKTPFRMIAATLALALVATTAGLAKAEPTSAPPPPEEWKVQPSTIVAKPTVTGPIGAEGIRTKKPYGTTMIPLAPGWIEQEFFYEGNARSSYNPAVTGTVAAYKGRILVRRPVDPAKFNGAVVLDWNNVTIPHDRDVAWQPTHRTLMARGMVYVGVAAQRLGVEASPAGLKQYDPVRYGSLKHPGDDYSFDIFTQAAEAVLDPKVLGALRPYVARRLASGASQSGARLLTYINSHQQHIRVFDGFQPQISTASGVNRKLVPIVWVNSQAEIPATPLPADSDLFRLWELAGPAHTTSSSSDYQNEMLIYSHSNGNAGSYDHESSGSWGYGEDPGTCFSKNWFQPSYLWSAAIVALDEWVRTGIAPPIQPRAGRDAAGDIAFDAVGNMVGGVRLPIVDVPIGAYFAGDSPVGSTDPCAVAGARVPLSGFSKVLDAATLKELYPTAQTYVEKFDAATAAAVVAGALLPEGAVDLKRRARIAAMWLESVT